MGYVHVCEEHGKTPHGLIAGRFSEMMHIVCVGPDTVFTLAEVRGKAQLRPGILQSVSLGKAHRAPCRTRSHRSAVPTQRQLAPAVAW
jgi:hypothetical protein